MDDGEYFGDDDFYRNETFSLFRTLVKCYLFECPLKSLHFDLYTFLYACLKIARNTD
jgi:hypothetical protein